ncbi:magnesium and cobalt transport protein CorA [Nocardiopsis potens]|uniref:magnesium and cobalt transport protein CorA n=1 Tax=Nocardiopsis potens TaxID=1246458 RepID=UPI0003486BAF|nr:magnesium and cobalt transport protein CorA [Nocardiopsis potens]
MPRNSRLDLLAERLAEQREEGTEAESAPEFLMARRRERRPSGAEGAVEASIYVRGAPAPPPADPADPAEVRRRLEAEPEAVAWIRMDRPSTGRLMAAAREFGLHELAVEDAIVAHQRPKLDRYGDTRFAVLRAAGPGGGADEVRFSEVHVFTGPRFAITVRHGDAPDLEAVRRRLEGDPQLLALGPQAVLYAVADRVIDDYAPAVARLGEAADEVESRVFAGDPEASPRVHRLLREVILFQRAADPLLDVLRRGLEQDAGDEELRHHLRDAADHAEAVAERVDGHRQLLQNVLQVNATLLSLEQNEKMRRLTESDARQADNAKKISAWAAILFAPSLIGSVYGMNFRHMPELGWALGYPMSLLLMLGIGVGLYALFKVRRWM